MPDVEPELKPQLLSGAAEPRPALPSQMSGMWGELPSPPKPRPAESRAASDSVEGASVEGMRLARELHASDKPSDPPTSDTEARLLWA